MNYRYRIINIKSKKYLYSFFPNGINMFEFSSGGWMVFLSRGEAKDHITYMMEEVSKRKEKLGKKNELKLIKTIFEMEVEEYNAID